MYKPIKAMGYVGDAWEDFTNDIADISLKSLSDYYQEVRVTFLHEIVGEYKEYRGINPLAELVGVTSDDTFSSWATKNGNLQIHGWDVITDWELGKKELIVKDLHYHGIEAVAGNNNTHPNNVSDRLDIYPDIVLYKQGMDWEPKAKNTLVSVNGLLNPIISYGDYALVDNGRVAIDVDKNADIELLSFDNIGDFDIVRVGDKLDPLCVSEARKDVTLDVPELFDSSFIFVLNGRPIFNKEMFKWMDKSKLRIKFANYDLKTVIAEDYNRLSFESQAPWWGGNVYNFEGMHRMFNAYQTFFIKFKGPVKLYTEVTSLQQSGFDNVYLDYDISADLLVRPDGRLVGKWIRHNGNPEVPHVVHTTHGITPRFWEHTGVDTEHALLTGVEAPDISFRSKELFKLKIYTI